MTLCKSRYSSSTRLAARTDEDDNCAIQGAPEYCLLRRRYGSLSAVVGTYSLGCTIVVALVLSFVVV